MSLVLKKRNNFKKIRKNKINVVLTNDLYDLKYSIEEVPSIVKYLLVEFDKIKVFSKFELEKNLIKFWNILLILDKHNIKDITPLELAFYEVIKNNCLNNISIKVLKWNILSIWSYYKNINDKIIQYNLLINIEPYDYNLFKIFISTINNILIYNNSYKEKKYYFKINQNILNWIKNNKEVIVKIFDKKKLFFQINLFFEILLTYNLFCYNFACDIHNIINYFDIYYFNDTTRLLNVIYLLENKCKINNIGIIDKIINEKIALDLDSLIILLNIIWLYLNNKFKFSRNIILYILELLDESFLEDIYYIQIYQIWDKSLVEYNIELSEKHINKTFKLFIDLERNIELISIIGDFILKNFIKKFYFEKIHLKLNNIINYCKKDFREIYKNLLN